MLISANIDNIEIVVKKIVDDIVVLPTDTLYALSTSISGPVKRIYEIKERDASLPIPIGVSDLNMFESICEVNDIAERLIKKFMPGALTLVLPKKEDIRNIQNKNIGIRIPNNEFTLNVIKEVGPITLTSANIHGQEPPVNIRDAEKMLENSVELYVDSGVLSGKPSTVISLVEKPKLIRKGAISWNDIRDVLNGC